MKNESVIKSIVKFDDPSGLGYLLKTSNKGSIKVDISNGSTCCEQYYANAMQKDKNMDLELQTFVGKTITGIDYRVKKYNSREMSGSIIVTITLNEGDPLKIYLTNEHNGYYSHGCSLEWSLYIQNALVKKSVQKTI